MQTRPGARPAIAAAMGGPSLGATRPSLGATRCAKRRYNRAQCPSEAGTAAAMPGSVNRAVPYTMQMRVRRQCCIAGRTRPAYWCRARLGCPRGEPRGARLADIPARLFLCARCREQVLLCSHCDRGQLYCGSACSGAARRANQRDAGRRYQRSPEGRIKHAARQRRWRQRRREPSVCAVTHHGSPDPSSAAPLPACPLEPADLHLPTARDDAHEPGSCQCATSVAASLRGEG